MIYFISCENKILIPGDPFLLQPCSSNKIIKTSDGCAIVLELSKNDPFFDKKKVRNKTNGLILLNAFFF